MKKSSFRLVTYLVLMSTASVSYGQVPESLKDCMSISVAIERLSCFDREMARLAGPAAVAEEPVAIVADESTSKAGMVAAELPSAAPPSDPAASRTTTPQSTAQTEELTDSAGTGSATAGQQARKDEPANALEASVDEFNRQADARPEPIREVTALVTSVSKRARGEHVVELENGQVWQENFASRYMPLEPGDEVTIRKRRFGGYRLVTPSGKGYRVKRVR